MTPAPTSHASVSNLVMSWDPPGTDAPAPTLVAPRYELLAEETTITWEQDEPVPGRDVVAPRERRSAYELAFLMLAAALAILVSTPPLVQLFLAMRGIEA